MSIFKKALASVGVGAAKLDTVLKKSDYLPGEQIEGEINITGGNVAQNIDAIYVRLYTQYEIERDDKKESQTALIGEFLAAGAFTIEAKEKKVIPFSSVLPYDIPFTIGRTKVWISTGLDIKQAIDPNDVDHINIVPSPFTRGVFHAFEELGFHMKSGGCKEAGRAHRMRLPFVQEFEFVPVSGSFRGKLDEVELVILTATENELDVMLQIDRKQRGLSGLFAEALDMDESYVSLRIHKQELADLKGNLYHLINKYAG
ncbi:MULTISPECIES: sporulation protein [Bacillaceae]|uniref:sporulation protein n=1 Tax=Bacillaceae TaxID=186817 RepID=UPI001E3B5A41|nr:MULTISPECIES: sporulation protein [Bacillaceae]MCE4047330.1 sporulation protein [Bacillus sp. Au-Bac7]MCM3030608.1 sporulation protein [Niallia sp. MER 6]MDL0437129.1 sporulation protein [Niallia sp. SS-2023]UPO86310.1 sporulation protein [Niallia sp. Man26]